MKSIVFAVLFVLAFLLSSCMQSELLPLPVVDDYELSPIVEKKHLRVGVVSGPYWDMFIEAVLPGLAEKGYTAAFSYYYDYTSPNFALARNEIDLNIFQHYVYLNTFKFDYDLALTAIMEIPTVSMGVFSNKYINIEDIERGANVAVPNDASNFARALRVLEAANVITLDPFIDKLRATEADIISNPLEIQLMPYEAHRLVELLDLYDAAVINGNFAVSGGLNPAESLYREILEFNYMNVIAVRTEDLKLQFVRDIIEVIYSESFRNVITDPYGKYTGFQQPRWLLSKD